MPTPFYHLSIAREILEHPGLSASVRALLLEEQAAFLFGNTAPDVQTISKQARAETHFFDLPLKESDPPPWRKIFEKHGLISDAAWLSRPQKAFLAGYLCHLQADWMWVCQVFVPTFGKRGGWATLPQRMYLHNVLRSYLDLEILPSLTNGVSTSLRAAAPVRWLPFVQDEHLVLWRDFLAGQLRPGAAVRTVEVFAARQGISPDEYYRLMSSEDRMDMEIFTHLPRTVLSSYRQSLVEENIQLIQSYLCRSDY